MRAPMRALPALFCLGLAIPAPAQWLNYFPPGTPMTADGKPDLSAPAPHAPDGKPDLTGVWHISRATAADRARMATAATTLDPYDAYSNNIFKDMKPEDYPERPAAVKLRTERMSTGIRPSPTLYCLPMGLPVNNLVNEVVKFVQAPTITMVLYEVDGTYRQIHTDGRKLPEDPTPSWLGYSTGHWDGDTLVVESNGFNDRTWLDSSGHPHSEALHLTERYRRRDFGHLDVEMTFDDPVMYTRPFTIRFTHQLLPGTDILESYCNENEKDRAHLKP